jgi:photosystem II stability/assembly factor-like uncharacterized protein
MKKFFKFIPAILGLALLGQGCFIQINGNSANDGGVWRSVDRGEKWAQANGVLSVGGAKNMNNANIISLTSDPSAPQTIYAATSQNGMLFSVDGGQSWSQPKDVSSALVGAVAVDYKNKCVVYAVSGNVAVKTDDCTRTWSKIYDESRGGVSLTSIIVDHFNPRNVYLATSKGDVLKSTDAGTSWATSTAKPWGSGIVKLVMDPFDSRVVFAGTKSEGVWKTTDAGASWVDMSKGLEQFDGAKDLYDLVPDRAKSGSYVLVCRYGLVRSDDGGTNWKKVPLVTNPGQARIYSFAMNPANGQEMYYSTATVFYKSMNGGVNWTTKRLPTSRIGTALLVSGSDPKIIYLGTQTVKK